MANERMEGVKFSLKTNSVEMSSTHQDFGDAQEEVEVVYDGPPLQVGFNARYLIEALNVIEAEDVLMELKDEGSPGILKPSSSTAGVSNQISIIMPMRL